MVHNPEKGCLVNEHNSRLRKMPNACVLFVSGTTSDWGQGLQQLFLTAEFSVKPLLNISLLPPTEIPSPMKSEMPLSL